MLSVELQSCLFDITNLEMNLKHYEIRNWMEMVLFNTTFIQYINGNGSGDCMTFGLKAFKDADSLDQ